VAAGSQSLPWARASRPRFHLTARLIVVGPLLVGVLVALPLVVLLAGSFNLAGPGREAIYGIENWQKAFTDALLAPAAWA
jgi:hypothetical protein